MPVMIRMRPGKRLPAWVTGVVLVTLSVAASEPVRLWPDRPPGETGSAGPEQDTTKDSDNRVANRRLIRLGNVSDPTIQVFPPPEGTANGAAVLVCPGGGYHILALDLEGTEVCDWLHSIGVTGVLLKYRVPKRADDDKHVGPLQDAQRAMGILRERATELRLDPHRIGVLGFSAGGHLAATLSNTPERVYPRVDAADDQLCRPDFTILIYPAYLTLKDQQDRVAPEMKLSDKTPPTFLTMAQDDPVRVETALHYAVALQEHKIPFELHIYPKGGHGYGLRRTDLPVTQWPDRAADWLRAGGWLKGH